MVLFWVTSQYELPSVLEVCKLVLSASPRELPKFVNFQYHWELISTSHTQIMLFLYIIIVIINTTAKPYLTSTTLPHSFTNSTGSQSMSDLFSRSSPFSTNYICGRKPQWRGKPTQSAWTENPIHMQGSSPRWDSNPGPKRSQAGKETTKLTWSPMYMSLFLGSCNVIVFCVSILNQPLPFNPLLFVSLIIVYTLLFYVCFLTPFMYFYFTAYMLHLVTCS